MAVSEQDMTSRVLLTIFQKNCHSINLKLLESSIAAYLSHLLSKKVSNIHCSCQSDVCPKDFRGDKGAK